MIFSLEMLQAKQGDCLLLHYGTLDNPKIMIIDGGPGRFFNTFKKSLKPRLKEIKDELSPDQALTISMTMISHMDDDHADGIVNLLEDIESDFDDSKEPLVNIENMWFNTFDDIIGNIQISQISSLKPGASVADISNQIPALSNIDHHAGAVVASTKQGRDIRNLADKLSIPVNSPFKKMGRNSPPMVRADSQKKVVDWGDNLSITVLHPNHERLKEMQKKWDQDLKKALRKGDQDIIFASIASRDKSPFNLASIVCMIEFEDKRLLLTGDAREDDILQGLQEANLLDDKGKIVVDVLKIPHHGSDRNVSREFFERIKAKHYVISADGSHHNPDKSTLVMLSMATRGRNNFTIHMTNEEGKHDLKKILKEFIDDDRRRGRTYKFEFREEDEISKTINLLEDINY
jgi:hypothetical protein